MNRQARTRWALQIICSTVIDTLVAKRSSNDVEHEIFIFESSRINRQENNLGKALDWIFETATRSCTQYIRYTKSAPALHPTTEIVQARGFCMQQDHAAYACEYL